MSNRQPRQPKPGPMEAHASILDYFERLPQGTPVMPKELRHLGSRSVVTRSLRELVKQGKLLQGGHGVYFLPVVGKFGVRPPSVEQTVRAIGIAKGETVVASGAVAANCLGLTKHVPVRPIFLTSGRSRKLNLGKQVLELKHAPSWQLTLAERPSGQALRALAWLGSNEVETGLKTMREKLSATTLEELARVAPQLPKWLRERVGRATNG